MSVFIETELNEMEGANRFWREARRRVLDIARSAGFQIEIEEHDSSFLFDLFDYGENVPSDEEILEAVKEYIDQQ